MKCQGSVTLERLCYDPCEFKLESAFIFVILIPYLILYYEKILCINLKSRNTDVQFLIQVIAVLSFVFMLEATL
jgi:hypothetical protein